MSCIYRRCMCLAICLALGVLMAGSAMGEAAEVKSLFDESFWEELGLTTLSQCSAKSRAAIGNQVFSLQSDGSIYIYDAESGQYRYWTQGGAIPRTFVSQYSMLDEQTQQELDQALLKGRQGDRVFHPLYGGKRFPHGCRSISGRRESVRFKPSYER